MKQIRAENAYFTITKTERAVHLTTRFSGDVMKNLYGGKKIMSEPTFTPGPWNVAGFDSRINEERYFGIDTPRGQMIVESFGECDFNRKANAALIAAAPEMYEFIAWLRTVEGQCAILKAKRYLPQILDKLDEILKKARGEK